MPTDSSDVCQLLVSSIIGLKCRLRVICIEFLTNGQFNLLQQHRWFFIMIAISGLFSVTFSVVFAYVADLTTGPKRSSAYGQVSATFAASLIISPALGAHLSRTYGDNLVILLATGVAVLDVLFILFIMPESLPEKLRSPQMSLWDQAAPLTTMRKIGRDFMIWTLCLTVFLSYLPEAGEFFFQKLCLLLFLLDVFTNHFE